MKKQLKDMRTLFLLSACLLMAACTGRSSQASNDDEAKPVITVTLEPQRYFTEAIAGDKFKVVSMVPKGSSPETYDPVPQQLVSLGDSKAYFRIVSKFPQVDKLWLLTGEGQMFADGKIGRAHV